MNIAAWVERAGRALGDRPALGTGKSIVATYGQMADKVSRLAGALRNELKLDPGDRVAIAAKNSTDYAITLHAIWHAGLAAVPINAKLHANEFAYIFDNCGARACFTSADLTPTIRALDAPALERIIEHGSSEYAGLLKSGPMDVSIVDPNSLAWLFYTSGTTGMPKGAMLSHRNLLTMSLNYFADMDKVTPDDCILHAAPMSHGSGLYMLPHIAAGACNVIPESGGFYPPEIFELIDAWPGLTLFGAPTMVRRLTSQTCDFNSANLKLIVYGGAPMYVEDCIAALERFGNKLAQIYGQGESPMTITHLSQRFHAERDHPRWRERLGSTGIPQSCVQVRLVDGDGTPLPAGEKGEICVRGDVVMMGYWENRQATAQALQDGWLHTGDIGVFDEDGFLTLTGRSKDVIISGGTNIYPREIEEVLLRHPGVAEISVIGRLDPDWGESVVAFIVREKGADCEADDLNAYCLENMARFKRPKAYRFIDALPKNNYGKVLKTELREIDAGG
ncbi:MAG: class I adenylate-forming enzyme family protein [Alphaproteobacteria bacterium]